MVSELTQPLSAALSDGPAIAHGTPCPPLLLGSLVRLVGGRTLHDGGSVGQALSMWQL